MKCTSLMPVRYTSSYTGNKLQKFIKDMPEITTNMFNKTIIFKDFAELYKEMERRKYNTLYIIIGAGIVLVYIFYGFITDWASDQAADVTKKYLKNPKFQSDIFEFSQKLVCDLSESAEVQDSIKLLLSNAITELAKDEEFQNELTELMVRTFSTTDIKTSTTKLSSEVVTDILNSEEFLTLVSDKLKGQLLGVLSDTEVQKEMGNASYVAVKTWFGVSPK